MFVSTTIRPDDISTSILDLAACWSLFAHRSGFGATEGVFLSLGALHIAQCAYTQLGDRFGTVKGVFPKLWLLRASDGKLKKLVGLEQLRGQTRMAGALEDTDRITARTRLSPRLAPALRISRGSVATRRAVA